MCTHCGCGHDHHTHDISVSEARAIAIEEDILGRNNAIAEENRALFSQKHILALNLVSSPGSGKTELLTATIMHAKKALKMALI